MESDTIGGLCEMLATSDLDGPEVLIKGEVHSEGIQEVSHCLVKKILAGKRVNREAFKEVIEQLWSSIIVVEIEMIEENIFMFYFLRKEDRGLVWARGPWHFDGNLIVMEKAKGPRALVIIEFKMIKFWVQIHQVPLMCMNRKATKILAEQIGIVIEIPADSRECWGKFPRVRVKIDISKPLKICLKVRVEGLEKATVASIHYKRLPDFCFACGMIGHIMRDCEDILAKKEAIEGKTTRYGPWMKAIMPDRLRMSFKNFKKGDSQTRAEKGPVYGDRKGMYSEGSGVKGSRATDTVGIITGKPKRPDKGMENSGKGGCLGEERLSRGMTKANFGTENGDGRYTKELKGLSIEAVKDGHGEVRGCDEESNEVLMEGMEGDESCVDVVDENMEGMSLSPGKRSVRKWRRAARKKHGPKGMVGVSSLIKRILEACQIIKNKSRDGNPSPSGKAQSRGESSLSPSNRKQEREAKRKLAISLWNKEIKEKK
ncbi:hypothetical protein EZV62_013418 [Acer yangbiense]|uniref:CCHC-type domain-containing protein n=1 Tax=Acer yangbiense TaxID=1000413 RepID=A0A5C7HYU1_9ROSI|nr:hypothetical protein EZV62_013418 [Acer yangbiense]